MQDDSWCSAHVGDVLTLEYGSGLPEAIRSGQGFPVYGSSGIVGYHEPPLAQGPGIVVGRKGSVGAVSWSGTSFWPIDTTYYVRPLGDVDLRWCYWILSWLPLRRLDSSTGVPGLNRNDAYQQPIMLPSPQEQRRIAAVLDTADAALEQTETLIEKLELVRAGLLHDLLAYGLDEHGELRDPGTHPEQFTVTPLGQMPENWGIYGLEAFVQQDDGIKPGPFGSSLTKATYTTDGYRVYGQEQVIAGSLSVGDYFIPESKYQELHAFAVRENDILMSLVGTTGKVLVVTSPFHPGVINPRLIRLRPQLDVADAQYLRHLLTSPLVRAQLSRIAQGGTMEILNGLVLRRLVLPRPDLQEQRRIADILNVCDARINAEGAYRDKLKLLKQGLMDDLLTGRVRVPVAEEAAV